MNTLEFGAKTLILYSLNKNERVDLSCLPDDVFDEVIHGLINANICREGSPFTGKFVMEIKKVTPYLQMLRKDVASTFPRVNKLISFLDRLAEGDVFRMVSLDAPTMNKQLAVLQTKGLATGEDDRTIHNRYIKTWGALATSYQYFAFGYDGLKTVIGEGDKKKRRCRFCGKKEPEAKFNSVAHAISEGLGNKLLICNEECDDCNNKLSKTESNLMHYLDVRRALGGILTKTEGTVPSVDGKGFVIRGDETNQAILYIEQEFIPDGTDTRKPFLLKLETNETVTHQGIFKALCKIAIDLLPASEMVHFGETIRWINGSVMDNELPPYFAAYGREYVQQPTVDIFLSKKPGQEPYCTTIVHILDVIFIFILPEVDVDRAQFRSVDSVSGHLGHFASVFGGRWQCEDTSEYTLAFPWVMKLIRPDDPKVIIRPKSDGVFMRYERDTAEKNEKIFPPFVDEGISEPILTDVVFERHSDAPVSVVELRQVSVNYDQLLCDLDKTTSSATFSFSFNFADSTNRYSYFDFSFKAKVHLEEFDKYIETGEYFCLDYHLRDYLCKSVLEVATVELKKYTEGTAFLSVTLQNILDERTIRQLYYRVPVDGSRYLVVKDADIHNL